MNMVNVERWKLIHTESSEDTHLRELLWIW